MRKVQRLPEPDSLKNNVGQWTKDLLDEIKSKGAYAKVDRSVKDKYRQEDVKETLEKMYNQHCCYCESVIGTNTYGRIEHLKPKSLPEFYHLAFDWENLHWCCEICNTSYKKARWDFQNPILDPSKDDIDRFLELNLTTGEYSGIKEDERAATTIRHTGINRDALVKARRRIIIRFLKDFKAHQSSGNEKEFCRDWKILKEDMDFPSLYDTLIQAVSD